MKQKIKKAFSLDFTLVELLVVIAIMSILMSVMLPALRKARESTNRVACMNNQRQFAPAFSMYSGESCEYFPPYCPYGTSSPSAYGGWVTLFQRSYLPQTGILNCPSSKEKTDTYMNYVKTNGKEYANYRIAYGYNAYWVGSSRSVSMASNIYEPAKISQLATPSKVVLLVDAYMVTWSPKTGSYTVDDSNYDYAEPDGLAHQNGVNILWCDGHVSFKEIKNIANPYADMGSFRAADSLWKRK